MLNCEEIVNATCGKLICGDKNLTVSKFSTDSRKIELDDFFIPLVGENFDGHDYIKKCLEDGAIGCVTEKDVDCFPGKIIIKVENTLKALRDIATCYRQKFHIPFVGITGSVGKTSTKEMIASVLGEKYNVLKTKGNFNNEIGLPLTVLRLDNFHEVGVIEMGMSGLGEISRLTSIVKPDVAVITNVGMSHIEKLGSKQNILKAKMEIIEGLSDKGLVVLNGDDNLLAGMKNLLKQRTVFYGLEDGADFQAYNIKSLGEKGTSFEITIVNREYKVKIPTPGIHNVYNALAAIAVGVELKVPIEKIIMGIDDFSPGKMRLDIITKDKIKIINDAYNASPQSMEAAIDVLFDVGQKSNRKIAILGDMLEMGNYAYEAHVEVGKYAVSKGIDYIITVGENGENIAKGAKESGNAYSNVFHFPNNEEVKSFLKDFLKQDDIILVKGSRGMKMEELVEYINSLENF